MTHSFRDCSWAKDQFAPFVGEVKTIPCLSCKKPSHFPTLPEDNYMPFDFMTRYGGFPCVYEDHVLCWDCAASVHPLHQKIHIRANPDLVCAEFNCARLGVEIGNDMGSLVKFHMDFERYTGFEDLYEAAFGVEQDKIYEQTKSNCQGHYTCQHSHFYDMPSVHLESFRDDPDYQNIVRSLQQPQYDYKAYNIDQDFKFNWMRKMQMQAKIRISMMLSALRDFDFPKSATDEIMEFADGITPVWRRIEKVRINQIFLEVRMAKFAWHQGNPIGKILLDVKEGKVETFSLPETF